MKMKLMVKEDIMIQRLNQPDYLGNWVGSCWLLVTVAPGLIPKSEQLVAINSSIECLALPCLPGPFMKPTKADTSHW